jgi:hypothetical protein
MLASCTTPHHAHPIHGDMSQPTNRGAQGSCAPGLVAAGGAGVAGASAPGQGGRVRASGAARRLLRRCARALVHIRGLIPRACPRIRGSKRLSLFPCGKRPAGRAGGRPESKQGEAGIAVRTGRPAPGPTTLATPVFTSRAAAPSRRPHFAGSCPRSHASSIFLIVRRRLGRRPASKAMPPARKHVFIFPLPKKKTRARVNAAVVVRGRRVVKRAIPFQPPGECLS